MRIVFMGTPDFATPSLRAIGEAGHDVALVVTQPDRPAGRGHPLQSSPVKTLAQALGLNIAQPESVNTPEFIEQLRTLAPDVVVVVAFGQILSKEVLDTPRLGCVNVHASLLPKYRGAAPIQHALMNGETVTGITTLYMTEQVDAGDILLQKRMDISPEDTYGTLYNKLAVLGAEALVETLGRLERGETQGIPQNHAEATHAPSLKKDAGRIDWQQPATAIVNLVRATNPRPGAFTMIQGKTLKIWRAAVVPLVSDSKEPPGQVREVRPHEGFVVNAGTGAVLVLEVQAENRRRMLAAEWLRGNPLREGERLGA
ncbi:MAG: methionyl-tRNA formyltransferase [Abditibacteriales bacterium]|nr:methionyl-tRNA formyltransferase [Abditibacteriales bacterium]MDW8364306.1 methionyl-tRNA formyltransferase [Abditibacteriales bacterium]